MDLIVVGEEASCGTWKKIEWKKDQNIDFCYHELRDKSKDINVGKNPRTDPASISSIRSITSYRWVYDFDYSLSPCKNLSSMESISKVEKVKLWGQ